MPDELSKALTELGLFDFSVEPELYRTVNGVKIELQAGTHPSVIYVKYKSILPERLPDILPEVKIEISCLSMDEPVEDKLIQSFISTATPDAEDVSVTFKTVTPTRTFLEKIFLLHEEFQKEHPRSIRMSRHLYDLECIMDRTFGSEALSNMQLYNTIVTHRSIFNKQDEVDYATHAPMTIKIIPPQEFISEWKKDYNTLLEHFLYYKEKRMPFTKLIERMSELTSRIKQMK